MTGKTARLKISRGIADTNSDVNAEGLANVNPIFTWVRLAQRIPVRIQIDKVPDGVVLVAGRCSRGKYLIGGSQGASVRGEAAVRGEVLDGAG